MESPASIDVTLSTIFSLQVPGEYSEKYSYSRYGNPTRDLLEASLAKLDEAQFGKTYSSKIAASLAMMSSLKPDDRVIFINWPSGTMCKELCVHLKTEFLNIYDVEAFKSIYKDDTKMIWIETPSNWMEVVDINEIAGIVHAQGNAILVVDNSLLTPYFQRPLELRADAVIYSLGEFISGHSDVTMGAITTNSAKLDEILKYHQYSSGMIPSPFDCFIVHRSLKTLSVRMERHSANACIVAEFLENHQKIGKVFHTSLKSHRNQERVDKQSEGHPAILTFQIKGSPGRAKKFLESLKAFIGAEIIGGVESSASVVMKSDSDHEPCDLVRLSIGLENAEELIADLEQALSSM